MKAVTQQLACMSCGHQFVFDLPLFMDVHAEEDQELLEYFFDENAYHISCPACSHSNHFDYPVTVYDMNGFQILHYLPDWCWDQMITTESFEQDGLPTRDLLIQIVNAGEQRECPIPSVFVSPINTGRVNFRVFFTLTEMRAQLSLSARMLSMYREKIDFYKKVMPPVEFLERGSRQYKKEKIKMVYAIGQVFTIGNNYSESDVSRIIAREMRYFDQHNSDVSHIRVALVELGILARTRDCRMYWREPDLTETNGYYFPPKFQNFEKVGYQFYEGDGMGFSVGYNHTSENAWGTCFIYDSGLPLIDSSSLPMEYDNAMKDLIDMHVEAGGVVKILDEWRVPFPCKGKSGTNALDLYCSSVLLHTAEGDMISHLLVTVFAGGFVKIRFTANQGVLNHKALHEELSEHILNNLLRQKSEIQ